MRQEKRRKTERKRASGRKLGVDKKERKKKL